MINKIDEGCYSLGISDLEKFENVFEDNNVALNGHSLEEVIIEYCKRVSVDIKDLEFDSESDLFCVYARNAETLKPLQQALIKIIDEPLLLESSITSIEFEEELSDDDFERILRERSADEFSIKGLSKLKVGTQIRHPSFGNGVIKSIMVGDSDIAVLEVFFGQDKRSLVLPGPVDIEIIG